MAISLQSDIYLEQRFLSAEPYTITDDIKNLTDAKDVHAAVETFLNKYPQFAYIDDLIPGRYLFHLDLSPYCYKPREELFDQRIQALSPDNFMNVAARLESYVKEVKAISKLYEICDGIIQKPHSRDSLEKLMLYHFVFEFTDFLECEVGKRLLPITDPDDLQLEHDSSLYAGYWNVYKIPFVNQKTDYRACEDRLKQYEIALDPYTKSQFWCNPNAMAAADQIIWKNEFLGPNITQEDRNLMQGPASELARRIRKCLDDHVNSVIYKKTWIVLDRDQHSLSWRTTGIDIALYLWLITTQLVFSKQKSKICPICGESFLTSRSDKVYCNRHTKSDREKFYKIQKYT